MAFYVFWADSFNIAKRGYGRVAHAPFIFDSNWKYHREASTYLIERATCTWPDTKDSHVRRYPTKKSLQSYAESLTNFLEWAISRTINWRTASYTEHLYECYQKEMLNGRWSASGKPLSSETVNRRIDEACSFLKWAAARGLRREFSILTEIVFRRDHTARNSHGHRAREIKARIGRVRPDPKDLRLPTDAEIGRWLRAVGIQKGPTKNLMCRLVVDTAIRREEAAAWRVDTLPERVEDWHVVGEEVRVTIKYGCKGQDYGEDNGDKIGPARHVWMSMTMAYALHDYRRGRRLAARAKWVRTAPTKEEQRARITQPSPHLFLSDENGMRITAASLYDAWTDVAYLPFPGWSVHGGRHWWACKRLLREHQKRMVQLGTGVGVIPLDWLSGNALSDIQLHIRPQLGHIDKDTSESYVRWVIKLLETDGLQIAYQDHLDEIEMKAESFEMETKID